MMTNQSVTFCCGNMHDWSRQDYQVQLIGWKLLGWGCSSVGRSSDLHTASAGLIPQCGKGFFLQSNFSADSYGVCTLLCAITCIHICVHVKDSVVHVRVLWIMKTLKHPACTAGWVARLSQLAFLGGRQLKFLTGEMPLGQYSCKKLKVKNKNNQMTE